MRGERGVTRPVFLTGDGQFACDIFVTLGQENIDRSTVTPRSIGFVDLGVGAIILDFAINGESLVQPRLRAAFRA